MYTQCVLSVVKTHLVVDVPLIADVGDLLQTIWVYTIYVDQTLDYLFYITILSTSGMVL